MPLEIWDKKSKQKILYIEHEKIIATKTMLKSSFKNCNITLLKSVHKSDQPILKELIYLTDRHEYHTTSMCQLLMTKPWTKSHKATLYLNNKEVNSDLTLELTNGHKHHFYDHFFNKNTKWLKDYPLNLLEIT